MSNLSKPNLKYGQRWAVEVYKRFEATYRRACLLVWAAYGYTKPLAAASIVHMIRQEDQSQWERYKKAIKAVDEALPRLAEPSNVDTYENICAFLTAWSQENPKI